MPHKLIYQNKKGFTIPLDDWFREKRLKNMFQKILKNKIFIKRKIYKHKNINKMFKDHLSLKENYGKILWLVLNFEIWSNIFMDKKILKKI